MPDALALVVLAAAVGGAAGKFVEKAWVTGEKWIDSFFKDHRPKAIEQAKRNCAAFLNMLAQHMHVIETQDEASPEAINSAQEHPEFSATLQKAILSAAQTDNQEKHQLLGRLVAEKVKAKPESLMSLATKMACDAVVLATPRQLRILALDTNILYVKPSVAPVSSRAYEEWLEARLKPYSDLDISRLDLLHLESGSCLRLQAFVTRNLAVILADKCECEWDPESFLRTRLGKAIRVIWEDKDLQSVEPTSVGQLLGGYVNDVLTGDRTNFSVWE